MKPQDPQADAITFGVELETTVPTSRLGKGSVPLVSAYTSKPGQIMRAVAPRLLMPP